VSVGFHIASLKKKRELQINRVQQWYTMVVVDIRVNMYIGENTQRD